MGALSFYLEDTAYLLTDTNFQWNSKQQLTRWVNSARRDLADLTACIERHLTGQSAFGASAQPGAMIPGGAQPGSLPDAEPNAQFSASTGSFQTIPGVERYPFQGFANPVLQAAHEGCDQIVDVALVTPSWGGTIRPALDWLPWPDLQAQARAYANLITDYPFWWSVINSGTHGEVFLFPTPSQGGEMEWDVFCLPKDIYSDDDYDAIPESFRRSVKFKAAALAFLSSNRYAQAETMQAMYMQSLGISSVARDRGKAPSMYAY